MHLTAGVQQSLLVRWRSATGRASSVRAFAKLAKPPTGVVKNAVTRPTPRLTPEKVFERLFEVVSERSVHVNKAYYTSEIGGIITEPALMLMHFDDAAVQSAFAVEEQARLIDGYIYNLDRVVERLLKSAQEAGIAQMVVDSAVARIILDTAAASMVMDGYVRVWMTPGRQGGSPALYVLVTTQQPDFERNAGVKVVTTPVPPSPVTEVRLATTINDTLCKMEAQSRDANTGIYVDSEGYIIDSPGASVGIITKDNILVTPPPEVVLPTSAMELLLQHAPEMTDDDGITVVESQARPVHMSEVAEAREVFLCSVIDGVVGVVEWDGRMIGEGIPGNNALAFDGLLHALYDNSGSELHYEVPFGYLTGMRDQLR